MEMINEIKSEMINEEKEEKMEIEKINQENLLLIYYFGTNYYEM